jgi:hypothetical protein
LLNFVMIPAKKVLAMAGKPGPLAGQRQATNWTSTPAVARMAAEPSLFVKN